MVTHQQITDLAATIEPRYRTFIRTAAMTGLRGGELAALQPHHIDILRRTVHVEQTATENAGHRTVGPPKTAASVRTVAIPAVLADELATHMTRYPGEWVFTTPTGAPMRMTNFRRREWRTAVRELGLGDVTPHDLRHSHVAHLIEVGVHPSIIAARLGHKSVRVVLDVYGGLMDGVDQGAADRLNDAWKSHPVPHMRPVDDSDVIPLPSTKAAT